MFTSLSPLVSSPLQGIQQVLYRCLLKVCIKECPSSEDLSLLCLRYSKGRCSQVSRFSRLAYEDMKGKGGERKNRSNGCVSVLLRLSYLFWLESVIDRIMPSSSPAPQNETIFENCLYRDNQVKMRSLRWALI